MGCVWPITSKSLETFGKFKWSHPPTRNGVERFRLELWYTFLSDFRKKWSRERQKEKYSLLTRWLRFCQAQSLRICASLLIGLKIRLKNQDNPVNLHQDVRMYDSGHFRGQKSGNSAFPLPLLIKESSFFYLRYIMLFSNFSSEFTASIFRSFNIPLL